MVRRMAHCALMMDESEALAVERRRLREQAGILRLQGPRLENEVGARHVGDIESRRTDDRPGITIAPA